MNTATEIIPEKQSELLQSQTNANEQENNSKSGNMIEMNKIEGTPFVTVGLTDRPKDRNTFIAIGNNRITEMMSQEEAEFKIATKDWNLITSAINVIAIEAVKEYLKEEEKKKDF
ncbi:MAG: hypothetical protein [Microviridae sp.]|nr:MAG: hypothetical protein [Microviridae sp.]